jgi:HlyD family secretion protein
MNPTKLQALQITLNQRQRAQSVPWIIFAGVAAVVIAAAYFAWPKAGDERRVFQGAAAADKAASAASSATPAPVLVAQKGPTTSADAAVLTASGYIINRERIEVSPRMMGQVKWIGVKKGDLVTKDQVVVRLDDAEQRARMLEIEAQVLGAKVALERAKIAYARVKRLRATNNETAEREDEARLTVQAGEATVQQFEGMRENARVALDWTVIRSPIDGVVLEKLAVAGALVTPQSFGGTKGPSTALFAVADPQDLQVEIDVNESDLPKIFLNQKCRVTPEAYPDKHYGGVVAEMAPEANRQKGTLQIKVQIENPDRFLTPELSAKVEFLKQ